MCPGMWLDVGGGGKLKCVSNLIPEVSVGAGDVVRVRDHEVEGLLDLSRTRCVHGGVQREAT